MYFLPVACLIHGLAFPDKRVYNMYFLPVAWLVHICND